MVVKDYFSPLFIWYMDGGATLLIFKTPWLIGLSFGGATSAEGHLLRLFVVERLLYSGSGSFLDILDVKLVL